MTRGLRNNNPGNIRHDGTRWQGEIIPSTDFAFKQFKTMAYGYRAMLKLLRNYALLHHCYTIRTMVSRWAPPSENDTKSYITTVAKIAGIDPDRRIDIYDRHLMCSLAGAMSRVENGTSAVMADVEAGWNLL